MHPGLCSPPAQLQPESRASPRGELQSPAAGRGAERRGAGVTWVLGLGGLFLSAAVAAGGPGPFVWSGCGGGGGWGGPSGQAGGFPSSLGPAAPRGRWGAAP